MFPTRRLSLPLMMVVFPSTALASAYEIDRPDFTVQPTTPYYPLLFSAFISNLASHLGLGNSQKASAQLGLGLRFGFAGIGHGSILNRHGADASRHKLSGAGVIQ
jgi:hypothetical protein